MTPKQSLTICLKGIVIFSLSLFFSCSNAQKDPEKLLYGLRFSEQDSVTLGYNSTVKTIKKKPQLIAWNLPWEQPFPRRHCDELLKQGSIPYLIWEPQLWDDFEYIDIQEILDGIYLEHITEWAVAAKNFGYPVFIEFAPQVNGDYVWSMDGTIEKAETYKRLTEYVVSIFKKEGAYNVLWVWSFKPQLFTQADWAMYSQAYPGDDVIDWVAISGGNDGSFFELSTWKSPEELYADSVEFLTRYGPKKPLMLCDVYSRSDGGDNKKWYGDLEKAFDTSLSDVSGVLFSIKPRLSKLLIKNSLLLPHFDSNLDDLSLYVGAYDVLPTINMKETFTFNFSSEESLYRGATYWDSPSDFSIEGSLFLENGFFNVDLSIVDDVYVVTNNVAVIYDNDALYFQLGDIDVEEGLIRERSVLYKVVVHDHEVVVYNVAEKKEVYRAAFLTKGVIQLPIPSFIHEDFYMGIFAVDVDRVGERTIFAYGRIDTLNVPISYWPKVEFRL